LGTAVDETKAATLMHRHLTKLLAQLGQEETLIELVAVEARPAHGFANGRLRVGFLTFALALLPAGYPIPTLLGALSVLPLSGRRAAGAVGPRARRLEPLSPSQTEQLNPHNFSRQRRPVSGR